MTMTFFHQSVMPSEVMSFFQDAKGKTLVDATAGGGGHLLMLAQAVGESGRVFAFDKDPRAHADDAARGVANQFPTTVTLFHQAFSNIKATLHQQGVDEIDGLICDLGVSSHQLDDKSRGFSFMSDGPIDMRMDTSTGITAYQWLQRSSEEEIANALYQFGGERKSRAIARKIKATQPLMDSTLELARIIVSAMRQKNYSKAHPATRSFQAIRIAINQEVVELEMLLKDVPTLLAKNGVAVFLSFHSLEDRIIKQAFKNIVAASNKSFVILTKKPTSASEQEVKDNRRARSAKLRALMRVL